MEATNKVGLGLLNGLPVLLQVVKLVAVGRGEVGAHAAVLASDDHTAATSGCLLIDTVADLETGLLAGIAEGVGVLVLADAAEVDNAVGWEDVLLR